MSSIQLDDQSNGKIIQAVLQACMGRALKISDILEDEGIAPVLTEYGEARVRSVVYSLATVGWLYRRGRTNSAWYQTTLDGKQQVTEARFAV